MSLRRKRVLFPQVSRIALSSRRKKRGEDIQKLNAIEVTGSRIKRAEVEGQTPVLTITSKDIEATGLGSIGDVLQQLTVSGSALNNCNAQFRSATSVSR